MMIWRVCRRLPLVLGLFACLAMLQSCAFKTVTNAIVGSGTIVEKEHTVEPFERLVVGSIMQVTVKMGEQPRIVVRADDNLVDRVQVTQSGKEVTVSLEPNLRVRRASISVEVTTPELQQLTLRGASRVTFDAFRTDALEVKITGAAKVAGRLSANRLTIDSSGATKLELQPIDDDSTADEVRVDASGAVEIDLRRFPAKRVAIRITGFGKCTVRASEELTVRGSGTSLVTYFGNPATVTTDLAGPAKVTRGEEE